MSKFFRALCCCSGTGVTNPVAANQTRSSRNTNPNRSQRPQNVSSGNNERRRSNQRQEKKPEKKFLKLKSSHTSQDVRYADVQSQNDKDLKFNCPICFRFFDRILVGNCCYNYLCHFCAEDVNERVKKDDKVLVARCPFCDNGDFVLYDVDIKEKPKKYTDSFYSTIKSAGKGNFKSKLFMNNNPEDDQASNVEGMSPNPDVEMKDRRAASDGMVYLQKEMLKVKANRTVGTNPEEDGDFHFNQTDNVLANQSPIKLEYSYVSQNNSSVKPTKAQIEEEIQEAASDDSLNQRDPLPIDVIKEDEFESSIVPDTAKQQEANQ